MERQKTFTVTFNSFEPGTYVTPASGYSALKPGTVHRVSKCWEPLFAGDKAVVLVEGRTDVLPTSYLREATGDEIVAATLNQRGIENGI